MPRNESGLSTKAHCCLCAHFIDAFAEEGRTFEMPANLKNFSGEIAKLTENDLLSIPGVGKTTAKEIREWLAAQGYAVRTPNLNSTT
jgi:hypothetical protein